MNGASSKKLAPSSGGRMNIDVEGLARQCVGCGLCASLRCEEMVERDGFMRPDTGTLRAVVENPVYCPVMNWPAIYDENVWGKHEAAYLGWSEDEEIRRNASSGGVLTEILCHLLETGEVDAVMQVGPSADCPLFSEPKLSRTVEEVVANSGSRYVSCDGLGRIAELLDTNETFALVGRPCEVRAVRLLMETDKRFVGRIAYLLSFFCMGAPSMDAVRRLDARLNPGHEKVVRLRYRGDGWPGYATETFVDGSSSRVTYDESWGQILGRDLESYCRFCFDGLGEYADVSAGDAWHQNGDGTPDFKEHDGRNVIFARTPKGKALLDECAATGALHLEPFSDWNYLSTIQKSQYQRKMTLAARLKVLKLTGRRFCSADILKLGRYSKQIPLGKRLRTAYGMFKRVAMGRVRVP